MDIEISQKVDGPWCVLGDFNSVMNLEERIGSQVRLKEIQPMRTCVTLGGYEGNLDHSPIVVHLFPSLANVKKPFQFLNMWCTAPTFMELVENSSKEPVSGNPMFKLVTKLKRLKPILKKRNKEGYNDIQAQDTQAFQELIKAQQAWYYLVYNNGEGSC